MPTCQHCNAELDHATLIDGKCPVCGRDAIQAPDKPAEGQPPAPESDPDTIQTMELPEDADPLRTVEPSSQPGTVQFAGEATIEFGGDTEDELSLQLVTSQWESQVAASDPHLTIRQGDTVSGSGGGTSSLVVKSRQFRSKDDAPLPAVTPANAPDYELLDVIGEGGMGVVYSAKQASIARTVAIKMLKQKDVADSKQREKFISEAVVTGELDHPNIVPIYDLGANDAGALFYSMKRVKGTPWNKVIGKNSLDENLGILMRVADAVSFAHANGVVHRDLKPENVMLGDYGEVLVMDWGLARISPEFPNAGSVAQSEVMGGTPAYMAPEMATGPVEKVTTASDVYLLGAILFEIITGRPPHSGKTVMACLFAAAKNAIEAPESNGELMNIAMHAMATQPQDRFHTVREFQRAVRLYQSHSESVVLTESAERHNATAKQSRDYELFSRAMYGLQEALSLWPENGRAVELLSRVRLDYAGAALAKGDFDLGLSLLDAEDPSHADTRKALEKGRLDRQQRQRRMNLLKGLVAVLVLLVIGVISVAYVAVSKQRDEAVFQRDRAVVAEKEAKENYEQAEEARAEEARQREIATENAEIARREEARAKEQEKIAVAAKEVAVAAQESEEYAAYVARIGLAKARLAENSFGRAAELLEECPPELRNWEWGRLWHLCNLSERTLKLGGPVEAVAFSPDGKLLLTGDWTGKARLWDADTGEQLSSADHGQYVHAVAFDPTGERFATGSSDRKVRISSTATGQLLATLEGHEDAVLTVRFSPDGRYLLTGGYHNTARLWDAETGQQLQVLLGHSWWVWSAEFSPDGSRIVTAGQDGKVIVWQRDEPTGPFVERTEFDAHEGPVYAARFAPDGLRVASAGYDGRVLTWNPDEVHPVDVARRLDDQPDPPAPFREVGRHDGPVRTLCFSPDGARLVSGGQDNVIRVADLDTGDVQVLRGHASHVLSCAVSPDGQRVLSGGRDETVRLWRPATYTEQARLVAHTGPGRADAVLEAAFSTDGSLIATAGRDRTATVWDSAARSVVEELQEGHEYLASTARFFDDGTRLATGAGDGTVRLWDVGTGTEIVALKGTGRTSALDVAPRGDLVATGDGESSVVVWDAVTGNRLAVLSGHEDAVTCVAFSPDGNLLASGDERGKVRLWTRDGQDWAEAALLEGHSRAITAMAFSPDGAKLFTASGDNTCGQWDVASGSELRELVLRHPEWVTDMSLSADGSLLLTSCDDGLLRVWSTADAQPVATIRLEGEPVVFTSVDIAPDGSAVLAACAADGTVRLWRREGAGGYAAGPDGPVQISLGEGGGRLWAARFSPDGAGVLTVGGNDARLWDLATGDVVRRFSPHGAVASVDFSPSGDRLVTGSWDRSAKVWDLATGHALLRLDGEHSGFVNSVRYSPDGRRVLTASDDGTVRLWDAETGQPLEPALVGHSSRVRQAVFNADGSRILTASSDKTARVWDAQSGRELTRLVGHNWAVLCGAFSPTGEMLATGGEDNLAMLWDADGGEPLLRLSGHTGSVTSVAFSRDGTRLATGSVDGTVRVWDTSSGEEVLALEGHTDSVTSVGFSPDGLGVIASGRDGATLIWPASDWRDAR